MRLTQAIRDAFVRAVMDDLPKIEYKPMVESMVSSAVKKVQVAAGIGAANTDRLKYTSIFVQHIGSIASHGLTQEEREAIQGMPAVLSLANKSVEQERQRNALRDKLMRAAAGFTTRKQLAEAMPEFEKYLPADEAAAIRSLPVVTNVVSDFQRAGWPK